jgi:hypothetical protein
MPLLLTEWQSIIPPLLLQSLYSWTSQSDPEFDLSWAGKWWIGQVVQSYEELKMYFFCTNFFVAEQSPTHMEGQKYDVFGQLYWAESHTERRNRRMCAITSMHKFLFIRHDWLPKSASKRLRSWALWHFSCFMSVTLFRLMLCCSNST